MFKKVLTCSLVAMSLTFSMSASAEVEKGQLNIWVNGDKAYDGLEKVGQKFTKDTGIKVIVSHPSSPEIKFQTLAEINYGPDIFMWAHDRLGEWVGSGLVQEVIPSKDFKDKLEDLSWNAVNINGKYYGYPLSIDSISMICNKDIIAKAPSSIEDLIQLDLALTEEGKHALMWDYTKVYMTYGFISAGGGYVFKNSVAGYNAKDVGINNDGAKAGLKFVKSFIDEGHMSADTNYGTMDEAFKKGEVACIFNGPWSWAAYDEAKVNYSVNKLPTLKGNPLRPFVGVQVLLISKASPNYDIAKKFLEEYLINDDGLKVVNDDKKIGVSALKSFEATLEGASNGGDKIKITLQNAQQGHVMPNVPEMSKFWGSYGTALKDAVSGKASVDSASSLAEERILDSK